MVLSEAKNQYQDTKPCLNSTWAFFFQFCFIAVLLAGGPLFASVVCFYELCLGMVRQEYALLVCRRSGWWRRVVCPRLPCHDSHVRNSVDLLHNDPVDLRVHWAWHPLLGGRYVMFCVFTETCW